MALGKAPEDEKVGAAVLKAAMRVHSMLGPGLLESAYETCLAYELQKAGLKVERQVVLPIEYDGVKLDAGYRLDILVEQRIVVEIKAIDKIAPIHVAQALSYLKLGHFPLGYLLNFHVLHMRQGIKRVVL